MHESHLELPFRALRFGLAIGAFLRADPEIASLLQQPDFSKGLNTALSKAGFQILVLVRVENVRKDADGISNATPSRRCAKRPARRSSARRRICADPSTRPKHNSETKPKKETTMNSKSRILVIAMSACSRPLRCSRAKKPRTVFGTASSPTRLARDADTVLVCFAYPGCSKTIGPLLRITPHAHHPVPTTKGSHDHDVDP